MQLNLGPKAGKEGGKVMFSGTVPEMLKSKKSITGRYLSGEKDVSFPPPRDGYKQG